MIGLGLNYWRRQAAGIGVAYLFRAEFNDPAAAPLVSPFPANVGSLIPNQTDGEYSVAGGKLLFPPQATPVYGDQGFYVLPISGLPFPRVEGRTLFCEVTLTTLGLSIYGWGANDALLDRFHYISAVNLNGGGLAATGHYGTLLVPAADILPNVTYEFVLSIHSPAGASLLIRGGQYNDYERMWVEQVNNDTPLYAKSSNYSDNGAFSHVRVMDIGGSWAATDGTVTQRIAGVVAGNTQFAHEADGQIIWDFTALTTSGVGEIAYRWKDAGNHSKVMWTSDGAIRLREIVGGAPIDVLGPFAAKVTTGAKGIIDLRGHESRHFVGNDLWGHCTKDTKTQNYTVGKMLSAGDDGVVSNLVTYPRRFGANNRYRQTGAGPAELTAANRVTLSYDDSPGTNYTGFPAIEEALNGDMVAIYTRGSAHNSSDQKLVIRRRVAGIWGAESDWHNTPGRADTGPTLRRLASGRLFASYCVDGGVLPLVTETFVRWSDDSGVTWSVPVSVGTQGFTYFVATGGKVLEAPDGTLLLPVYARNDGENNYTALLIQSTDDGATWTTRAIIAQDAALQFEEVQVDELDDGRLMASIRVDNDQTIRITWSSDWGLAWTKPVVKMRGHGWPVWIQLTGGVIIMLGRTRDVAAAGLHQSKFFGCYTVSYDRGWTWQTPQALDPDNPWAYMYGDLKEVSPNVAGVMHAAGDPDSEAKTAMRYLTLAV